MLNYYNNTLIIAFEIFKMIVFPPIFYNNVHYNLFRVNKL